MRHLSMLSYHQFQSNPLDFENYYLRKIRFEIGERHIATYNMSFQNDEVRSSNAGALDEQIDLTQFRWITLNPTWH
jgi:hypothetical protein